MTSIDEEIKRQEEHVALCKEIQKQFPKTQVSGIFGSKNFYFSSSEINSIFTYYEIDKTNSWLKFKPYSIIRIESLGQLHSVKIHSKPYTCTLAEIKRYPKKPSVMRFNNFNKQLFKHNDISHFLDSCKEEIMNYIKENSHVVLDKTNLDPQIKKFLAFA